jgi:hypothetical protein
MQRSWWAVAQKFLLQTQQCEESFGGLKFSKTLILKVVELIFSGITRAG